jgi:dTDP-4-dehydrorhamnose 3,5-epimerase
MKIVATALPDLLLIEPEIYEDERGEFFESFNQKDFDQAIGYPVRFVQDNQSCSVRNVLRGLHYQIKQPQCKLVRVVTGEVFDVSVDLRQSSPTFGKWFGVHLSEKNKRMLWIPEGFTHGFAVLSEYAVYLYKTTAYWSPEHERCIIWNDPDLAIDWHLGKSTPLLSAKDQAGKSFLKAEVFA